MQARRTPARHARPHHAFIHASGGKLHDVHVLDTLMVKVGAKSNMNALWSTIVLQNLVGYDDLASGDSHRVTHAYDVRRGPESGSLGNNVA